MKGLEKNDTAIWDNTQTNTQTMLYLIRHEGVWYMAIYHKPLRCFIAITNWLPT
jgi:hypothetical protein